MNEFKLKQQITRLEGENKRLRQSRKPQNENTRTLQAEVASLNIRLKELIAKNKHLQSLLDDQSEPKQEKEISG